MAYFQSKAPSHCLLMAASGVCERVRFLPPHLPVCLECQSNQQASCAREKVGHPSATLANLKNVSCRRLSGSCELFPQVALVYNLSFGADHFSNACEGLVVMSLLHECPAALEFCRLLGLILLFPGQLF